MQVFYLSVASGSQKRTVEALDYPYVLVNFLTKTNTPPKSAKVLFVDSGGFHSSFVHGGYNKSDAEYLHFVRKTKADYFALRDYPCEPQILKKHNVTVKDQILRTVNHHIKLLDLAKKYELSAKPIPVIQGWEIGDYLFCLDKFREHGLIGNGFDYIAIGSLCRRHATTFVDKCLSEMDKVVDKLSEALGIFIWFDWDADEIEIKIDRILPDEDDEDWIFSYVLRCKVYANPSSLENINEDDFLFESETIAGLREEWRRSNELFRKIWLKRDIPAFFEGDSDETA